MGEPYDIASSILALLPKKAVDMVVETHNLRERQYEYETMTTSQILWAEFAERIKRLEEEER